MCVSAEQFGDFNNVLMWLWVSQNTRGTDASMMSRGGSVTLCALWVLPITYNTETGSEFIHWIDFNYRFTEKHIDLIDLLSCEM